MPSTPAPHFASHPRNGLADYIFHSRYAGFRAEVDRRETYIEAVDRVKRMHRARFAARLGTPVGADPAQSPLDPRDREFHERHFGASTLDDLINRAFLAVAQRWVLPSMRSLQYAGPALEGDPARMFNCAFSPVDRLEFFREYFYLLLAGAGCGFSVQYVHTARLPPLPLRPGDGPRIERHVVQEGLAGWADALHHLVRSHFDGFIVAFDHGAVEPAAGRSQAPLRRCLGDVSRVLLAAAGRRLQPIEIYDICMYISRAVLGAGHRRSASICLFSADDEQMGHAKTGAWLRENPQRAASNNSAVFLRPAADAARFARLGRTLREFGEPGFYFSDDPDYGTNPCGEAGLHPVLAAPLEPAEVARLRTLGYAGPLPPAARLSGWQMCNLTTVNGAAVHGAPDLLIAAGHAAVIGTLQAAYTDIPYLGPVTRFLNEQDALLGVSICGLMENPPVLLDADLLDRAARLARTVNASVARAIGIRPAARVTCVKPEGTASLFLGTAPGIHPHPARRYFRRIRAHRLDPVYRAFRATNPEMTEPDQLQPATDDCLVFPVEAPPRALLRDDLTAVEFLAWVLHVQRHWVLNGDAGTTRSPGLHHGVSQTCLVRPGEWDAALDYIWEHRDQFTGVTLLGDDGARRYPQPPLAAATTAEDAAHWNRLACRPVDYRFVRDAGIRAPTEVPCCTAP